MCSVRHSYLENIREIAGRLGGCQIHICQVDRNGEGKRTNPDGIAQDTRETPAAHVSNSAAETRGLFLSTECTEN